MRFIETKKSAFICRMFLPDSYLYLYDMIVLNLKVTWTTSFSFSAKSSKQRWSL